LSNVGIIKTSGGLFDFLSRSRTRAPEWMQRAELEWARALYLLFNKSRPPANDRKPD
jgi:UDP-N-acetyl-D-mannosaminuronic acid transferase (WecB/TagA/CpsF family)